MDTLHLVLFATFVCAVSSFKLPSYITTCSRNDPTLNECMVKNGVKAIPSFIHGDPKYGVPNLDPLAIKELKVRQGTRQVGLNLTLSYCSLIGLNNAEFTNARVDLSKQHIVWDFINKQGLQLIGRYKASGQVLLLPILGEGLANITLVNLKNIRYKFDYSLYKGKNGKEYLNVTNSVMTFDIGRAYFKFENLFNGDKVLSQQMNRFLNENWKDIIDEFAPEVGGAIAEVFKRLLTSILGQVPFDVIFPDTKP